LTIDASERFFNPVVTRVTERLLTNRIIGLICPFLPPRDLYKCPPIRKMDGRGGGDRTHVRRLGKNALVEHLILTCHRNVILIVTNGSKKPA